MNDIIFNMFKEYFKLGLFAVDDCRKAVKCGYFGEEHFKEITGVDY
ncbi:MAG TPA: XkdX family protein [Lactobacillus sp.]|jgi:hypothetical protein|nr:XkdX family protein [Lactobacillus sp.]